MRAPPVIIILSTPMSYLQLRQLGIQVLTDYVGDGRLTKFGVRFTNQVWPGDDLDSTATFENMEDVDGETLANFEVTTTNQDGAVVLKGYAQARVD